ncbi:MAG: hypothetical protein CGU28_06255 [Candidatus Dactylopiibacterium carminicum]|nr:MAG: hypothetical protein CGU28_06255 [Candidatus Dactylopiibacterium carminicum]
MRFSIRTFADGHWLLLALLGRLPRLRLPLMLFALACISGITLVQVFGDRTPPPWLFSLMAAIGVLLLWVRAYRRYRLIADTPHAPIAATPQGFAAISGIGRVPPEELPLRSPLHYLPCLWYRVKHEKKDDGNNWQTEHEECSDAPFYLEDVDGQRCRIDPEGARVEALLCDEVVDGDKRTTQWLLIPGTPIHAVGHFSSRNPGVDRPPLRVEVRDRLAEWKASGHTQRFDLDGNGELDLQEWELARAAALRETHRERAASSSQPDEHHLCAPRDGRPFFIADHPPARFVKRLKGQAAGWCIIFLILMVFTGWLYTGGASW